MDISLGLQAVLFTVAQETLISGLKRKVEGFPHGLHQLPRTPSWTWSLDPRRSSKQLNINNCEGVISPS